MKHMSILGLLGLMALSLTVTPPAVGAVAQNEDIVGDWQLEMVGAPAGQGGRARGGMMSSLLTLSRDKDGKLTGHMIGMMGMTELEGLSFENGKLSFTQRLRMRQEEFVSQYTGTLEDGKLTVTQSSQRGDMEMEGSRLPVPPAIVGDWEITTTLGDRQMVTVLSVATDPEGNITARWQPRRGLGAGERPAQGQQRAQGERPQGQRAQGERPAQGERTQRAFGGELNDVAYKDGTLTFTRAFRGRGQQQDQQQFVTRYTLKAEGDALTGTVTTPQGEQPIEGKRIVSPAMGTWALTVQTPMGERTQRLVVYPDMSGMYGATMLDEVSFEDDTLAFTTSMSFGDRTIENTFRGTVDGDELTGQMRSTGFDGQPTTQEVVGSKL